MSLLKYIPPTGQDVEFSEKKKKGHDETIEGKYFNLQILPTSFQSQSSCLNIIGNTALVKSPRAHTVQLNLVICC